MKIERMTEIETPFIKAGDRIHVAHYTATCQEITPKGALFLMDQYLDEPMAMNRNNSNQGGYAESDLRKTLRSREVLDIFDDWRDRMVPFENGDLLRIPFAGELFGDEKLGEPDGHKQWPLMRDRLNQLALRYGDDEWGWLQNKDKKSSTLFCFVDDYGLIASGVGSNVLGVRLAFLIATTEKTKRRRRSVILDIYSWLRSRNDRNLVDLDS